jgi:hypothetical protein
LFDTAPGGGRRYFGSTVVDVVEVPGEPFLDPLGGGMTTTITPDVPCPPGPPHGREK